MKKKAAVVLSLVLALSVTACGGEKGTVASGNEKLPSQQAELPENTVEESTQTEEAGESISEETVEEVLDVTVTEEVEESETTVEETTEPVVEATPEPTPEPTAEPTSEPTPEPATGMRPEFKEAMDSYEAFYDEYCMFMKKYQENPTDLSLLAEYANMMNKLTEMDEKFDAWEDGDLNDEELKYYMEVQTRVSQKMLEIL